MYTEDEALKQLRRGTGPVVMAMIQWGGRLPDAQINLSVWPSEEAARDALRDDFAEELERTETEPWRQSDLDDDLLVILRRDWSWVITIMPLGVLQSKDGPWTT